MKLFLSHPSFEKSNIKKIIEYLPPVIHTWLDERNLGWGDRLNETFESTIKTTMDYVVVFISGERELNKWVLKELCWALEHQERIGRTFVLPVVMPSVGENIAEKYPEVVNLKFIRLFSYEDASFKSCADSITQHILGLLLHDLDRLYSPKKVNFAQAVHDADNMIDNVCKDIYRVVYRHREFNPITVSELYDVLSTSITKEISMEEFVVLLEKVASKISGLFYDGCELYVTEEHAMWKKEIGLDNKISIAYEAAKRIRNGMKVFIDAGSTTTELMKVLCARIESHNIAGIKLTIVSTEHASMVADCCAKLGYDQYSSPITLIILGGIVRPNTKAIVGINSNEDVINIVRNFGQFDLAFVGANGATLEQGILTHNNEELAIKQTVLENTKNRVFLFDDSKFGIYLESKLADFEDKRVKVITNGNENNKELNLIKEKYPDAIIIAKPVKK